MNYQDRKSARRAVYVAQHGVSQPRRVFRVYAIQGLEVLPDRFKNTPIGAFASRKEAEEFVREDGPGTAFGSQASKAVGHMMSREEFMRTPRGYDSYVSFKIVSEVA
jgi:hypothetical protein